MAKTSKAVKSANKIPQPKEGEQEVKKDKLIPIPINVKNDVKNSCLFISSARCGNCMHFTHIAHPEFGNVCKHKGITELNKPCANFSPDVWSLKLNDSNLINFAKVISDIPTNKINILTALLNKEALSRKYKLPFGTKVYINIFRPGYISNYFESRVFFANKNQVYLFVDVNMKGSIAVVSRSSVMEEAKFLNLRRQLLAENKEIDPLFKTYFTSNATEIEKKTRKLVTKENKNLSIADIAGKTSLLSTNVKKKRGKNKELIPVDIMIKAPKIRSFTAR